MSNDLEKLAKAAKELRRAVNDLRKVQRDIFFRGCTSDNRVAIFWGDPETLTSFWIGPPPRTCLIHVSAEGAQLLAENLNKAIAGARAVLISAAEDDVRQAKMVLINLLRSE